MNYRTFLSLFFGFFAAVSFSVSAQVVITPPSLLPEIEKAKVSCIVDFPYSIRRFTIIVATNDGKLIAGKLGDCHSRFINPKISKLEKVFRL